MHLILEHSVVSAISKVLPNLSQIFGRRKLQMVGQLNVVKIFMTAILRVMRVTKMYGQSNTTAIAYTAFCNKSFQLNQFPCCTLRKTI